MYLHACIIIEKHMRCTLSKTAMFMTSSWTYVMSISRDKKIFNSTVLFRDENCCNSAHDHFINFWNQSYSSRVHLCHDEKSLNNEYFSTWKKIHPLSFDMNGMGIDKDMSYNTRCLQHALSGINFLCIITLSKHKNYFLCLMFCIKVSTPL